MFTLTPIRICCLSSFLDGRFNVLTEQKYNQWRDEKRAIRHRIFYAYADTKELLTQVKYKEQGCIWKERCTELHPPRGCYAAHTAHGKIILAEGTN